jgi:hypothetical protein
MKLCPLFEKIALPWCDGESRAVYLCRRTIKAANNALPQEAIREAILRLENTGAYEEAGQLRALLTEEVKHD